MFASQIQHICRERSVLCNFHLESARFFSAVAWISLVLFLIGNVPLVLFYDLPYIVHITNFDGISVKDLA